MTLSMVNSNIMKPIGGVGIRVVVALLTVSFILYLATRDLYMSVIGPTIVALVYLSFLTVDNFNGDIRYVKLSIFIFGMIGGVIMFASASIPAWFGILIALVSLWWTTQTLVDISQRG